MNRHSDKPPYPYKVSPYRFKAYTTSTAVTYSQKRLFFVYIRAEIRLTPPDVRNGTIKKKTKNCSLIIYTG
jgi:hypothetical protein